MTIRRQLLELREELNDAALKALEILDSVIDEVPEDDSEEVEPDGA